MKKLFFCALLLSLSVNMYAHALWIETNTSGIKGQPQTVKIFYGEYAEFSPDKVSDWYSDVKDFKLWLIRPDGQKTQIETIAAADHYLANFTPDKDGTYTLIISHSAKELGGTTVYQFNTSAEVRVGKNPVHHSTNSNPLKFTLKNGTVNKPVIVQSFFKDAPSEKINVTVFSPKGWTKELKGKSDGTAEFVPEWKGRYMIEVSRMDQEKGEHYGKEYTGIWRCATYVVDIR